MKNVATALVIAFLGAVTLPVFAADEPKTADECKKVHAGDDAKIEACIKDLKK